jgi:hypothetical protein
MNLNWGDIPLLSKAGARVVIKGCESHLVDDRAAHRFESGGFAASVRRLRNFTNQPYTSLERLDFNSFIPLVDLTYSVVFEQQPVRSNHE